MKTAQALAMLSLQDQMNAKVNPSWRSAGFVWTRAIMVEGVEAMGHWGWKWWKKETRDIEQFKIELVDIWHFALSNMLTAASAPEVAAHLVHVTATPQRYVKFDGHDYDLDDELSVLETLDLLVAMAGAKQFSVYVFASLMDAAGMTWDELYKGYIAKNVLNFFRQDNGYKAGTYIKNWHGMEDNVRLAELTNTLDADLPSFQSDLYVALAHQYHSVLTGVGRLTEASKLIADLTRI